MRSHESIRPWANAQFDGRKVKAHTVRLTTLHAALRPYIERCAEEELGMQRLSAEQMIRIEEPIR